MTIETPFTDLERGKARQAITGSATALSDPYTTLTRGAYNPHGSLPLLHAMHKEVERHAGYGLRPVSTFGRVCEYGAVMKAHVDRPGLDWTLTMPLDDVSAQWPLYVEGTPCMASVGQGILAEGRVREHWRQPCPVNAAVWLLLHYERVSNPVRFDPVIQRGLLSPKDISRIYADLEGVAFSKGTTSNDNRQRDSQVAWLGQEQWGWLYDLIVPWMKSYLPHVAFDEPQAEAIQFTRYEEGGFYGVHRDNDGNNRRVASVSIPLVQPEFSGALEVEGIQYDLRPGDAVMFPSASMHQVLPVRGRRDSLVLWLSGTSDSHRETS